MVGEVLGKGLSLEALRGLGCEMGKSGGWDKVRRL